MADLKVALEDVEAESVSTSRVQATTTRPQPASRLVLVSLLVVIMTAAFFVWRQWHTPVEPLKAVGLTTFTGQERHASFSPDGNHVAFTWNGPKQDNHDIYVQQVGAGVPLRLTTDPRGDYNPVWSPDGHWIAFLRGSLALPDKNELRLIPPLGGPERQLAEIRKREVHNNSVYLAWCPNSSCLIVTDSPGEGKPDALFVISLETGEKRQLTNPQSPDLGDDSPAVSPDAQSLIFCRIVADLRKQVYWAALGKDLTVIGDAKRLTLGGLNPAYPVWTPDGREILFAANRNLWRAAVPRESPPTRLPFVGEDGIMPAISRPPPGRSPRLVYTRSFTDMNLWRIQSSAVGAPASSPPAVAVSSTRLETNPQISPDGRRVALCSDRSGTMEIWLADSDGSNATQLTSMGAVETCTPRWSPDGQLIAFDSNLEGHYEIYVVTVAGGRPRRVTSHRANDHVPSFSRDGKWIYFSSNRSGEYEIWKIPASGGDAVQITHNGGFVAFESPDGAYIYYTQTGFAPSALWRLPASGGEPLKVLDEVIARAFVVLERGMYYLDHPAEPRLQFFDFTTGKSITIARNLGSIFTGLAVSSDGRTILYSREDGSVVDLMLVENFR
jgi:Tol biopolymer transport system component